MRSLMILSFLGRYPWNTAAVGVIREEYTAVNMWR